MLSPLVKGTRPTRFVRDLLVYSTSGVIASMSIGYSAAQLGRFVLPANSPSLAPVAGLTVIALALIRESGRVAVPLPQLRRVSDRRWAMSLPVVAALALWGFDIGLFVTTRVSLLGAWLVPILAVVSRDTAFATALFATYWLGRVASTVVVPLVLRQHDAATLTTELAARRDVFRVPYVVALTVAAIHLIRLALGYI